MVESRILGEEPVEHRAEKEDTAALECLLIDRHRYFDAPRGSDAGALADAPYDRPAIDAAHAMDTALRDAVRRLREHRQGLLKCLRIAACPALDETEVIGAQHIDEAPGDSAGMGRFAAAAHRRYHRLPRRRRAGYADHVQGEVVDQAKLRAPDTNRKMLGEVAVRAQRPNAQFGNCRVVVFAPKSAHGDEHVRAG